MKQHAFLLFCLQLRNKLLFTFPFIILLFFISCEDENYYSETINELIVGEMDYLDPNLQPFAAWMKSSGTLLRSSIDPEIKFLIDSEKELFHTNYSYIEEFLKIIPSPQWESFKMIKYGDNIFDIFIPCINIFQDKIEVNDYVLVISKRGEDVFSTLKMLPRDESLSNRITVFYKENKVYLEIGHTNSDGVIISQNVGYITQNRSDTSTRSGGCPGDLDEYFGSITFTTRGDGRIDVIMITADHTLECGGGSNFYIGPLPGYLNTPSAAAGAGDVPPYEPFPSSGTGGSSGNSTGSSTNNSSGGSNNNYSGYHFGNNGSSSGGETGGVNSNNFGGGGGSNRPQPMFPNGGLDIIPMSMYK